MSAGSTAAAQMSLSFGVPGPISEIVDYSGLSAPTVLKVVTISSDGNVYFPGSVIPNSGTPGLGQTHVIPLQNWRTTLGAVLPTTSSTDTFFQLLSPQTSSFIESATTSAATETCGMICQQAVPDNYSGTGNLTLTVNANIKTSGTGTLVATLTAVAQAISLTTGTFGPNMITTVGSAVVGTAAAAYTFSIVNPGGTGGFVGAQALAIQLNSAQTESGAVASNVQINSTTIG